MSGDDDEATMRPFDTVDAVVERSGVGGSLGSTDSGDQIDTLDTSIPVRPIASRACLIEIHGAEVERRIDLDRLPCTLGRLETCELPVRNLAVSRQHARVTRAEFSYEVEDLESTNGTYVNDTRVTRCPLRHGDIVNIGGTIFRFLAADDLDAAVHEARSRIALLDGLTQVANRSTFAHALGIRVAEGRGPGQVAVIGLGISDFGALEERYGTLAGERVLTLLAGLLQQKVRRTDVLARVDHALFALLLDGVVGDLARLKADHLRRYVAASTFRYNDSPLPVTVRTAVVLPRIGDPMSPDAVLGRLCEALGP